MNRLTLAVLFGGKSSEYEVSLSSAAGVLTEIDRSKYDLLTVGITKTGDWYLFDGTVEQIRSGEWCRRPETMARVLICPDSGRREFVFLYPDGREEHRAVDAVFPVLHGAFGEDGKLQGLLAVAGIPAVGCSCLSSAVCMDKSVAKAILNDAGVRQARAILVRAADLSDLAALTACVERTLGWPVFVKPCSAGSSVGVSHVKTAEKLEAALHLALAEDGKVLIEEAIVGKEVEVAVLEEHGAYTVSVPAEIEPGSDFYDYETKYQSDVARFYIPARLDDGVTAEVRRLAEKVFRTLDCRGLSRVDFFVTADGGVILNEVNTLPGFTPISMYPRLMTASGMSYGELIDRLVAAAL